MTANVRFETALQELRPGEVAVIGVPFDRHSSFRRGAAQAPERIRQALMNGSSNLCVESGLDLGAVEGWRDLGDLELADTAEAYDWIAPSVEAALLYGGKTICLGGDHSITYPLVRAHAQTYPALTIVQMDAHPDLYDELDGDRYSHACPFARILEAGLAQHLVQVGVRTMSPRLREQALRFNVETIEMRHWQRGQDLDVKGPVYLSVDLDVLDPSCAPGVAHHEPGGLLTREVLEMIWKLEGRIVGADIVELNPERDWMGMTAAVAAKLLKELIAVML